VSDDLEPIDRLLAPVATWVNSRSDILGLAIVGSWARAAQRPDSDVDLVLLAHETQMFRRDKTWLDQIHWHERRVAHWHDAQYGKAWSRHVRLEPFCEIEFTFCAPSWAATDPVDPGTAGVISAGFRVLVDKARLFDRLLAH
jgi:hypothetical protein